MTLQRATNDNFEALFGLITQFYHYFDYPFDALKHRKLVADFLAVDYLGSIWLIQKNAQYVGYIALTYGFSFEFEGRDAFIDEFFIEEHHRNGGIGKQVLTEVQGKMTDLGLKALHLQTEAYNQRAKKLYESVNFKDLKRSSLTFLKKETPAV
jgi:ribosomal protein S18 acetylase RimI-like enzyme